MQIHHRTVAILALILIACGEPRTATCNRQTAQPWLQDLKKDLRSRLSEADVEGNITICIDTSGSITEFDFDSFLFTVNEIAAREKKKKPFILFGDTEVDWEGFYEGPKTLAPGSEARRAAVWKGRGGTDFRGLVKRALGNGPDFIIYLTDGFGILPEEKPDVPIVWILNRECWEGENGLFYVNDCKALREFGEVISIPDSGNLEEYMDN